MTVKTPFLLLLLRHTSQQIQDLKIEGLLKVALDVSVQLELKRKLYYL